MSQQIGPDQARSPVSASRHRLAQGQHATESRVPEHGVSGLSHLEHGAPPAVDAATLTLTAAHPHNALYQDAHGRAPTLRVQEVQASAAATELGQPGDFRSHPRGMAGVPGRPDFAPAPINGGLPIQPRPAGPAAVPFAPDALAGQGGGGGILQGPVPHVQAPGAQWSTGAPGDSGYSRFGAGHPS